MDVILFVLVVALVGAVSDVARGLIPNWLTMTGIVGGIALQTVHGGLSGLTGSLAGCCLGIALLIGFYACGGMGAGDVKLFGAVGSCLGPSGVMQAALVVALSGGIYALVVRARHRGWRATLRSIYTGCLTIALTGCPAPAETSTGLEPSLRYGIAIALGTTLTLWWRGYLPSVSLWIARRTGGLVTRCPWSGGSRMNLAAEGRGAGMPHRSGRGNVVSPGA